MSILYTGSTTKMKANVQEHTFLAQSMMDDSVSQSAGSFDTHSLFRPVDCYTKGKVCFCIIGISGRSRTFNGMYKKWLTRTKKINK